MPKPILIFDTSGINNLREDPDSKAMVAAIRSAFFVRLTETNLAEVAATSDAVNRTGLLDLMQLLLSAGDCIDPYHTVVENMVRSFETDPSAFEWRKVRVRFQEAEQEIARREFISDDLAAAQRTHLKLSEREFGDIYNKARPQFDELFPGKSKRPTLSAVLERYKEPDGAIWEIVAWMFRRTAKLPFDAKSLRRLFEACPPFRAVVLAQCIPIYERCVRSEFEGESYRAGRLDLFSATYLPYCDLFITHDEKQLRCLDAVVQEGALEVKVRSYDDFRRDVMGIGLRRRESRP